MNRLFYFCIIILFALFPLFDLLHPGLPITHDGEGHVARIANFYQSLQEGNIIPRWAGNLNWGYGHPILMFLYPLPSYLASFFHLLGADFVDSVKLVFAVAFVMSGIGMYLFVRELLGDQAGVIGGILYMYAPYRFVDLYVRGAIGEHVAFVFPPLILFSLLKISKKYSLKIFILCCFFISGLVLSHNAISIMFLPVIVGFICMFIHEAKNKKKLFFQFFSILILGIGFSSFFLLPAFFEGKYTLRDIVTAKEYALRFVSPLSLIYSPWNYGGAGQFSVQIGFVQIMGIITAIIYFRKYDFKKSVFLRKLFIITAILFILSLFITIKESNFIWEMFTILQKFQFPWRFLSVTVFTASILVSFLIFMIPKNQKIKFIFFIIFLSFLLNLNYFKANDFLQNNEKYYTSIYNGTTDTGESSPIWSIRFMEYRPKSHIEVISGRAEINEIKRSSTNHLYVANVDSETARIRENTLYFPGWNVYINNIKTNIEFQDPQNRGLMTFFIDKGLNKIELKFEDTNLRKAANTISIFSLIGIFIAGLFFRKIYAKNY